MVDHTLRRPSTAHSARQKRWIRYDAATEKYILSGSSMQVSQAHRWFRSRAATAATVYWLAVALAAGAVLLLAACERNGARAAQMPDPETAAERYGGTAEVEVRGNLLQVQVPVAAEMLRGGAIWARSGPYFYLFSPPTRDLFAEYPDLAAIRVITVAPDGDEVARAELRRDALSEVRWREALYRSAVAQRDGTERPRTLEELRYFGEDHTEFRYNPEFAGR